MPHLAAWLTGLHQRSDGRPSYNDLFTKSDTTMSYGGIDSVAIALIMAFDDPVQWTSDHSSWFHQLRMHRSLRHISLKFIAFRDNFGVLQVCKFFLHGRGMGECTAAMCGHLANRLMHEA